MSKWTYERIKNMWVLLTIRIKRGYRVATVPFMFGLCVLLLKLLWPSVKLFILVIIGLVFLYVLYELGRYDENVLKIYNHEMNKKQRVK